MFLETKYWIELLKMHLEEIKFSILKKTEGCIKDVLKPILLILNTIIQ